MKTTNSPLPIARTYNIASLLKPNKVIAIFGPRRSGKTTIVKEYLQTCPYRFRYETGDNIAIHEILGSQNLDTLRDYVGDNELIVIDEAHLIPNIGINLKLMVDQIPNIRIITTGSSSFDLANQIGEPLVGRKFSYLLYPISFSELKLTYSNFELNKLLEKVLIYGSYPEILTASFDQDKVRLLSEITNSHLFKDILIFEGLKNSRILLNLLRLLAFQIGSEVSLSELGNSLDIDKKTVGRYLDILEKTYIITSLRPYFNNNRQSIIKKAKYYFLDLGVRNTIIGNYNPLSQRDDIGKLWENFLVVERLKKQAYQSLYYNNYFWRTKNQQEIDWVEMHSGKLFGYEFKWQKDKVAKNEKAWLLAYPNEAQFQLVNHNNYLDFVI
ncbi:MAG: ATP-binding protein [bacterium]